MKTLDELIKALEMCTADKCVCLYGCPYSHLADGDDGCEYHAIPAMQRDALYYLKEFQRYQNTPSRLGHMALVDYFEEPQKNEPLTWDELKGMIGKPVWVEPCKEWMLITEVEAVPHVWLLGLDGLDYDMPLHKDWQAYRKERE